MGTNRHESPYALGWVFKVRLSWPGYFKNRSILSITPIPFLRTKRFHGSGCLYRKDNSSLVLSQRPQPCSGCPDRIRGSERLHAWYRNKNLSPFQPLSVFLAYMLSLHDNITKLPRSFRTDWLVSNCCSHETLLHFGHPGPPWIICYYHQDLHDRWLTLESLPKHSRPPARPSYSV